MINKEKALSLFGKGFAEAQEKKLFKIICPKIVEDAADILGKIL